MYSDHGFKYTKYTYIHILYYAEAAIKNDAENNSVIIILCNCKFSLPLLLFGDYVVS